MEWYIPLAVTFAAVFLAELGDKTQLMTISFSSKYPRLPVFFGAFLGLSVVTIVGVLVGTVLFQFIPILYVKLLSGGIFLLFGVLTLIRSYNEEKEEEQVEEKNKNVFFTTFALIILAELGDKTQFAVIALTAQYGTPLPVYIGAVLAFALIVLIGVILGRKLSEKVDPKWIAIGSGVLFIVIGIVFILEAVMF